jgi:hypothetical protein
LVAALAQRNFMSGIGVADDTDARSLKKSAFDANGCVHVNQE